MNKTGNRKPCYQISIFIDELHNNTAVGITAANSEALWRFLLYIFAQLNNYPIEKYSFLCFITLKKNVSLNFLYCPGS